MKEILLTQGKVALVDDEDYNYLMQWKWHAHRDYRNPDIYYVGRRDYSEGGNGKTIQMHRVVMNTPKGVVVDHIDHNGLNNQKSNLRNCTHSQNLRNASPRKNSTSKYLGVCYIKKKNYRTGEIRVYIIATIHVGEDRIKLGHYKSEVEAARAYDEAAKKHFGEFANLNFK